MDGLGWDGMGNGCNFNDCISMGRMDGVFTLTIMSY
jgi:hypothetical protein